MMMHAGILALTISSLSICLMLMYAVWHGMKILEAWDIGSGTEQQLCLERKTYLISTIICWTFLFQTLSLFLFIHTADDLHSIFTGAMCAAGTLNVNSDGYPTLALKVVNCLLAGTWLIINHTDSQGYDYPLIKVKYNLLSLLAVLITLEALTQSEFFGHLRGDIITSCCSSLFNGNSKSFGGNLAGFSIPAMERTFVATIAATLATGIYFLAKGRGACLYSFLCLLNFLVSIASILSFISLFIYELPTHHCPFCMLQREYHYVGYPLYVSLLGGTITGMGAGIVGTFRNRNSLRQVVPKTQRNLVMLSIAHLIIFSLITCFLILLSPLRL